MPVRGMGVSVPVGGWGLAYMWGMGVRVSVRRMGVSVHVGEGDSVPVGGWGLAYLWGDGC